MRIFGSAYCVGEPPLTEMSAVLRDVRARNALGRAELCWRGGCLSLAASEECLHTSTGTKRDGMIVIEPGVEGFGLYGPYIDLAPGRYLARIEFRWDRPLEGDATIDVCCEQVALILGVRHITSSTIVAEGMTAEVPFAVASPAREVEIRLACSAGFRGTIRRVEVCLERG
jgi:hypothetical protein